MIKIYISAVIIFIAVTIFNWMHLERLNNRIAELRKHATCLIDVSDKEEALRCFCDKLDGEITGMGSGSYPVPHVGLNCSFEVSEEDYLKFMKEYFPENFEERNYEPEPILLNNIKLI